MLGVVMLGVTMLSVVILSVVTHSVMLSIVILSVVSGNTKGGSITVPLTSCLTGFGLVCFTNKNKNCQLPYSQFQTKQTGGQQYSDTSPSSIPWLYA